MINKQLKLYSRFIQFALLATEQALNDSGLELKDEELEDVGVCVGSGIGSLQDTIQEQQNLQNGLKTSPYYIPRMLPNLAAGQISITHKFTGPSLTISTAYHD